MGNIFTKLFANKNNSKQCSNPECKQFMENLQLFIDGETSCEEEEFIRTHMKECSPCLERHEIESSLISTIKDKLDKKKCPQEIINTIKEKISQESISLK